MRWREDFGYSRELYEIQKPMDFDLDYLEEDKVHLEDEDEIRELLLSAGIDPDEFDEDLSEIQEFIDSLDEDESMKM